MFPLPGLSCNLECGRQVFFFNKYPSLIDASSNRTKALRFRIALAGRGEMRSRLRDVIRI